MEPVIAVRLHDKDLKLLELLQAYFNGIGNIYHHNDVNEATFRVGSIKELEIIINHFDNYPLITKKYIDFILFKQVIELMKKKEHLSMAGILKIANIKASMNKKIEVSEISDIVPVFAPSMPSDAYLNINPY